MLKSPHARLAAFLLLAVVSLVLAGPLAGLVGASGLVGMAWFGAIFAALLVAATVACARLSGERRAGTRFTSAGRRLRELGVGFVVGAALFAGVALISGLTIGGTWHLNVMPGLTGIAGGLLVVLCLFVSEELLFRGYAFRQLTAIYGPRIALGISAAAFGAYHLLGSGDWAMGAVYRFLMPALGGVVFGYAVLRTGSLALPIGLHWGGNWVQSAVFGLGHSPHQSTAIWILPLAPHQVQALAAPDLLPHLPYLIALALTLVLVRAAVTGQPGVARQLS